MTIGIEKLRSSELYKPILPSERPRSAGIKFDSGKPEYALIPPFGLDQVVQVLTYGAKKYAPENWRYVEDGPRRYFDAAQRHMWAIARNEILDPETNLPHAAHAIASLLFLLERTLDGERHLIQGPVQYKHKNK